MNEEFKHIIDKVTGLYQQYGIKSVTMDDVSRELGISKKTLYKYVSNKDELVGHFVSYKQNDSKCGYEELKSEASNAIEELLIFNEYVIEMLKNYNPSTEFDLKKYYPELYSEFRKKRQENMYRAVKENIERGKKEGLYRSELDEVIIAKVHVSRIENSFANEIFTIEELTSSRFVNEMMNYHIRGMVNNEGLKFLESKLKEIKNK